MKIIVLIHYFISIRIINATHLPKKAGLYIFFKFNFKFSLKIVLMEENLYKVKLYIIAQMFVSAPAVNIMDW